jgi:beta-glucanase (GH16 family)
VEVENIGDRAVSPRVRVQRDGNTSPRGTTQQPLAPGESAVVVTTFMSGKPWVGPDTIKKGHMSGQSGTGNSVLSDRISAVLVSADQPNARLRVNSVRATAPPVELPDWVGQRPPVSGEWELTFEDNFDGDAINTDTWNIYTNNYWDSRSHFTKDNVIVEDGKVTLRYEKKTGYMNDDPNDKHPKTGKSETDYAVGYLDTYDKWTQTYGYFEARMKLPEADGLWPAFWTMPDRGNEDWPRWKRSMTEHGGMEFDIMEHLTRWGPYRYNIAMHFDGYDKNHKATGSTAVYAGHDEEGYVTSGLLWLPGEAVFYANGEEVARWTNDRIASVPSYPILYMVSGGWDNNALDDAQLPADFVIDYVRVWQRKDLMEP